MTKTATEIISHYEGLIEMLVKRREGQIPNYVTKDDLIMEVKIKLLSELHRYDSTKAHLDTYVSRVIEYALMDYINSVVTPADTYDGSEEDMERLIHTMDTKLGIKVEKGNYKSLAQSLSSNDEEYTILILTAEGYTQTEIAKKLGISQSTVSRYMDAIRENKLNELQ